MEMKREVLRSFSLQHLLKILMACLASCERIGLFVAEQLCSAKADVNFWDSNWSHMLELCGPSSDMIAENCPHFFYTTWRCHFSVFYAFWRLVWNVFTCGSVSPTCPTLIISSHLYLSLIINMCILMAATIDAWKPPVSEMLYSAFYSRFMIILLSSLLLYLLV